MSRHIRCASLALLAVAVACTDASGPLSSDGFPEVKAATAFPAAGARAARERLARRAALALASPAFRARVKAQLDRSKVREHKVHFQRFLHAEGRTVLRALAGTALESESSVEADATYALPLEMYFPVPEHRARWTGDTHLLVATAQDDDEPPVAFDITGRRQLLSPTRPPNIPVLAVVPLETDFDNPATVSPFVCCGGGGSGNPPAGLYMTATKFVHTFEGWLKGNPEFEVHILGQSGQTDSLTSYQCAGEHASGYYAFDQNAVAWSGNTLLFTQQQLNSYRSQHSNQNFRILVLEDDDGACAIRFDNGRFKSLMTVLQNSYPNLTGSKDTTTSGLGKIVKRANALQRILKSVYSFITSQDDLVGNAVEDVAVGEFYAGFNWAVKGENNATNGWLKLQMR